MDSLTEDATGIRPLASKKKPWQKPELIILVRTRPEEAVLAACKGHPGAAGPQAAGCLKSKPKPKADCNAFFSS